LASSNELLAANDGVFALVEGKDNNAELQGTKPTSFQAVWQAGQQQIARNR